MSTNVHYITEMYHTYTHYIVAVQVMLADLAVILEVIPVPVVHPLPQELNGRLGPIHLPRRHVEIIHKHNLIKKTWTHHLYHVQFEIRSVNMNVCFALFLHDTTGYYTLYYKELLVSLET